MDIITVNESNLDQEHVCCSISEKKGETCLASRKAWMKGQFADGLTFKKLNINGKVFIEYLPAENAWCPIEANGYLFIKCFWVSGQYQGKGYANVLLQECIKDAIAQGKKGLVVLSSPKKMPFLSDPKYLKYKGFQVCDHAEPHFDLLYLPLTMEAAVPHFKGCCKNGTIEDTGYVLYYSDQCPYSEKYSLLIAQAAKEYNKLFRMIKITSKEQASNAPTPFTTYTLFSDGRFVTNEILTVSKFLKLP